MRTQFGAENDVVRRNGVRGGGLPPLHPWIYSAEARRLQAETVAKGAHGLWTSARRIVKGWVNRQAHPRPPAPNVSPIAPTSAVRRYSLNFAIASAISRGVLRLARLVRRSILERLARRRRRRIAIAQLKAMDDRLLADIGVARGEIERAVDGMLSLRRAGRPAERQAPAEESRPELPLAA